ncbi:glyoxalase [Sphaerisporangium siamense]|uniref:Putative enzyme related to lactoylglutathione lyase n=1 Tax=Sphaerisporangium siamense TaxID=795645 RepID=A0A7W7D8X2_9ACTN|nr:VOC family protein [Sphaerisporangium siamense]MBB4702169.1 putative enzyme related to lactoylglutathione lyase [Sphaerisporangium siamense]GII87138.1 glyoxalase [Sphaerisporangium siamense]
MSTPPFDTVAWFEVATDDPGLAQRFYGELFGWSFEADEGSAKDGLDYRLIRYRGGEAPKGGVYGTKGEAPGHAVFTVAVADVAATCDRIEGLGGKTVMKAVGNANGPDFAYVTDPAGNLFGLFTPRP